METVPPTPSPLFPHDLKTLFKLGPEDARILLRQYGLSSGVSSPITPKPKGLANENENEGTSSDHVEDMNKFMAHIGVCFFVRNTGFKSLLTLYFLY